MTLRRIVSILLIILAVLVAAYAIATARQQRSFQNPVAYTFFQDVLYVVEKGKNTVVALEHFVAGEPMEATGFYEIERDDPNFYFMVRKVFPGPRGLVIQSYIYKHGSQEFVGYRFSQYTSKKHPPTPLLTIFLDNPGQYPEITYACDLAGNHYFGNNCQGQHNIWKIPGAGGVTITGGQLPPEVQPLGQVNRELDKWDDIAVGPDGRMYLTSSATGKVVVYSPQGDRVGEIGTVGFNQGELLAPGEVFFARLAKGEPDYLTVASRGNRSWVQFDSDGRPFRSISPLHMGYPYFDILVTAFYNSEAGPSEYAFDLANRAMIRFDGRTFATCTTYVAWQWGRTGLLLALAGLILLAGVFLARIMAVAATLRVPFFVKLLALFVPVLILSAYIVGESVKNVMKRGVVVEITRRSANLAHAVLNSVALTDLDRIQRPEDREGPVYERIYRTIAGIVDTVHVDQTPKWILHKIHEGRYYFGINIWRGAIFEPFVVPSDRPMFSRVLTEKTCQTGRFIDDAGEWFSYLCPVLDGDGQPVYVLELYRPAEQLDRAEQDASGQVLRIIGATVCATVLLVLFFSGALFRPLRQLIRKTRLISQGDFDQPVEVRSRDELGDLARAFDQMVIDLKSYISELARTTAEKEAIQSELRLAHDMQQDILPKAFPPLSNTDNVTIFAQMEPAKEVGGDFYDFFPIDADHMGVVVGDVTGKGVPAGLFMMRVRAMLRSSAMGTLSAAEALARINSVIVQENPSATFATMFYFICDTRTGHVTFCNAGHNPPVWLKDGRADFLRPSSGAGRGLPVGALDEGLYADGTLTLAYGDSLVIYTDGVTEACNTCREMFGEERLIEVLDSHPDLSPKPLCETVFSEIQQHQAGADQFDDIAVLVFRFGVNGVNGGNGIKRNTGL